MSFNFSFVEKNCCGKWMSGRSFLISKTMKVSGVQNGLDLIDFQNVFFCVPQKKEKHTDLKWGWVRVCLHDKDVLKKFFLRMQATMLSKQSLFTRIHEND